MSGINTENFKKLKYHIFFKKSLSIVYRKYVHEYKSI